MQSIIQCGVAVEIYLVVSDCSCRHVSPSAKRVNKGCYRAI